MSRTKRTLKEQRKDMLANCEIKIPCMNTIGCEYTVFNQPMYQQQCISAAYANPLMNNEFMPNPIEKDFNDSPVGLNDTIYWICNQDCNFMNYMLSALFCSCQSYTDASFEIACQVDQMLSDNRSNGINLLSTELIKKLFYEHQVEMERSRRQILAELDSYPNESDIIFNNKTNANGDKFRGSNYRGVSVNGKSWQVFIVINKCKCYAGCVESEEKAAAIYDRLAIIFHGLKAKTNFSYTKSDVQLCFEIATDASK